MADLTEKRKLRTDSVDEVELRPDSLVGSYFHGDSGWKCQGCVIAEPAPGVYLVQLFSWMTGGSTNQQLVRIEDMTDWLFYDTAEWMTDHYAHAVKHMWAKTPNGTPVGRALDID